MRRSVLITLAALGGLICLIGGTGLFAALTDTARSGTNEVESAPIAASADIRVARAPFDTGVAGEALQCGEFSEDLATAFFTVENASPGYESRDNYYCVQNVGSQGVTLSALVDELVDVDFACTGDEELHGDTSCGEDGAGELSRSLMVRYHHLNECTSGMGMGPDWVALDSNASEPVALGQLGPGQIRCFELLLAYPNAGPVVPEVHRAQSDRVTWRFKWVAQA